MVQRFYPESEAQLADAVSDAYASRTTLEVIGSGSLRQLGRPVAADAVLSTSALSGIIDYQPDELMITVKPGTPMNVLMAVLAERGQQLAFEPPMLAGLWGGQQAGTIGGVIGANLAGPRRFRAGAARDHILAVRAVGGRGEVFKAGGKVVKNVTGYDLPKLLTGSFGTLAIVSEITLKVLPRPAFEVTLISRDLPIDDALALLRMLAGDPREPTGLALIGRAQSSRIAVRVEGIELSAQDRTAALAVSVPGAEVIEAEESSAFWDTVSNLHPLLGANPNDVLWRVSAPPSAAASILKAAQPAQYIADHAGGTLWLDRPLSDWEPTLGDVGATLIRGPESLRRFRPTVLATAAVSALVERVRARFDPAGILNPGRLTDMTQ